MGHNFLFMWKEIPGYEDLYAINKFGEIKSLSRVSIRNNHTVILKEKLLTVHDNGKGYLVVCLTKQGKQKTEKIHQLMAITFLNHTKQKGLVIDHIDGNSKNNSLNNLRIISQRDNCLYSRKKRSTNFLGVYKDKTNWAASIRINGKRKFLGIFSTPEEAESAYLIAKNSLI